MPSKVTSGYRYEFDEDANISRILEKFPDGTMKESTMEKALEWHGYTEEEFEAEIVQPYRDLLEAQGG